MSSQVLKAPGRNTGGTEGEHKSSMGSKNTSKTSKKHQTTVMEENNRQSIPRAQLNNSSKTSILEMKNWGE